VSSPVDTFEEAGIPYPFTFGADDTTYHDLVIHLAHDFVHHSSEMIDPIDTRCACGQDLGYDRDGAIRYDPRIYAMCPWCGQAFDATRRTTYRDGWTGAHGTILGAAYRFAVIVDCGKGWPHERHPIAVAPRFLTLVEESFGERFDDFGDFY
jgi:hypothetical protein